MAKKKKFPSMKEITDSNYKKVSIGNFEVSKRKRISHLQPKDDEFEMFTTYKIALAIL